MSTTAPPSFAVGSWAFSAAHGESVRILDVETVWNHTVYQIWIPRLAAVERIPGQSLSAAQRIKANGLGCSSKATHCGENRAESA